MQFPAKVQKSSFFLSFCTTAENFLLSGKLHVTSQQIFFPWSESWPVEIFYGQEADHWKNESNKSDFNEALEHNLEGKTSKKDRVSPEKKDTALGKYNLSVSQLFQIKVSLLKNVKEINKLLQIRRVF